MSRHTFAEVITNTHELQNENLMDTEGYSLENWLNYGILGWDDPMNTYFIQLDNNGDGPPPWWLGVRRNEISTFEEFCTTMNEIFNISPGTFQYENVMM